MDTIEHLTVAKILGVFVHSGFKCDNHVDFILSVCSQQVYLFYNLPIPYSFRILYALPAQGGLLSVNSKDE